METHEFERIMELGGMILERLDNIGKDDPDEGLQPRSARIPQSFMDEYNKMYDQREEAFRDREMMEGKLNHRTMLLAERETQIEDKTRFAEELFTDNEIVTEAIMVILEACTKERNDPSIRSSPVVEQVINKIEATEFTI